MEYNSVESMFWNKTNKIDGNFTYILHVKCNDL